MTERKEDINRIKIVRIREIMNELGFNNKEFAELIKMSPSYLSEVLSTKRPVPKYMGYKLSKFAKVNEPWYETGEGEMFVNKENNAILVDQTNLAPNSIPMYNLPAAASVLEIYNDPNDAKVIGHLSIPGTTKDSFALHVYGHSMFPTLENGNWCVLRPIKNIKDILWGEVYFIDYGDYRVFKRLLISDNENEVTLWSDNQSELINGRPKYGAVKIKKSDIRALYLLTEVLKKPNY